MSSWKLSIGRLCNNPIECKYRKQVLVELTKEPSYTLPTGLSREEKRKWISDIGNKLLTERVTEGEIVVKEWLVL